VFIVSILKGLARKQVTIYGQTEIQKDLGDARLRGRWRCAVRSE
jgi:hypothetical protein